MNTKQWRLYNFLKNKSQENPEHWVTHEEICKELPDLFSLNHKAINKMCSSHIQQHILKINEDIGIEKIIMYKNQSYRLAKDSSEAFDFIRNKLFIRGLRHLKRYWTLLDKIRNDGQMKLLSNRGDIIEKDSRARDYFETYLPTGKNQT